MARRRRDRSGRPRPSARARSAGPCSTSTCTAASSHRPSPARIVSAACSAGVSSSPIAAAMPPCAYPVLLSAGSALVRIRTRPAGRKTDRGAQARDAAADHEKSSTSPGCYPTNSTFHGARPPRGRDAVARLSRDDRQRRHRWPRAARSTTRAPPDVDSSSRVRWSGGSMANELARALNGSGTPAEPILVPDGERYKQLATVTRIYDALVTAKADRVIHTDHVRRRRHRRHGGLCRRDLPARDCAGARPDHAAGAGGQRDRRQGRRQPSARQEHDRLLLPAARRRRRPGGARHAAAARVPRRAVRSDQVWNDVERGALRPGRQGAEGDFRAGARSAHRRSSASRAASRPTWSPRTNAKPGRDGS